MRITACHHSVQRKGAARSARRSERGARGMQRPHALILRGPRRHGC